MTYLLYEQSLIAFQKDRHLAQAINHSEVVGRNEWTTLNVYLMKERFDSHDKESPCSLVVFLQNEYS